MQIAEHPFGFSWTVDEKMQRSGHALWTDRGIWLIDTPALDAPEIATRLEAEQVAGVISLLDRHKRDCEKAAGRYGVAHLAVPDALPGTPFEIIVVLEMPGWHERALWWEQHRVLLAAELLGTNPYFRIGPGAVGVHPMLRLFTPSVLRGRTPDYLLVGHGRPVSADAAGAIESAYANARSDLLRLPRILRDRLANR